MKTFMANNENIKREWLVVDATNQTLGRLAAEVAAVLRGKHKPTFTPHVDCGDNVIIINAEKVSLTGNKWNDKKYYSHSGYNGGLSVKTAKELNAKQPEKMVEVAIKGMLPKNKIGAEAFRRLYVYAGGEHKHAAQQPRVLTIKG